MLPTADTFSVLREAAPLRLMLPPLCSVRVLAAPLIPYISNPPAPVASVVLPVRVTSPMLMPPLALRLPVSCIEADVVAASAPMLTALTDPATRLSALNVVVPALVMVPVFRVPPVVVTLIATAPPPALMVPALVKPAALMPTSLALVTPPRVSADVVVAFSEPVPAAKVALANVLPAFDSVTPLPLTLMAGVVSAPVCVTAPPAVRLRLAMLTVPLSAAPAPLCALSVNAPPTLARVRLPLPAVSAALPVSVVPPSVRLPLALNAPLRVDAPVLLK